MSRLNTMGRAREFKFDRGDWVALRVRDEWKLVGKVVDADHDSCTVERRDGPRDHFVPEQDPIVHAYWRNRRWYVR